VDCVLVYCVNDGAVMKAWAKDQQVDPYSSLVMLAGDPHAQLTNALGMQLTHAGPASVGIVGRCKRHAAYIVNGTIKANVVSEAEDDPAGDDKPEATCAPAMLETIKACQD
jgi:peroxiredoxin